MTDFSLKLGGNGQYYPIFLSPELSHALAEELLTQVRWTQEEFKIFGKKTASPRMLSSMFDLECPKPSRKKAYWNENSAWVKVGTKGWTPLMGYVKACIESLFKVRICYAQLNHYRSGNDYIGWHTDKEMGDKDIVFSLSLGNTRRFAFRDKKLDSGEPEYELNLVNGSLITFDARAGKENYKHALPQVRKKDLQDMRYDFGRINITFRTMYD